MKDITSRQLKEKLNDYTDVFSHLNEHLAQAAIRIEELEDALLDLIDTCESANSDNISQDSIDEATAVASDGRRLN